MIGRRILELRQAQHLTQAQLAERVGVQRAYIALIETGRRVPGLTIACKLARALGVTVDELCPDAPTPEPALTATAT